MKCKICKKKSANECCSVECAIKYIEIKKQKDWQERKKIMIENLETTTDIMKKIEVDFNTYIRKRDFMNGCISCGKAFKLDDCVAGHFYDTKNEHLRFNELNVNAQCIQCNKHFHGNLIKYRINLEKKIGTSNLKMLDELSEKKYRYNKLELKHLHNHVKNILKNN